MNVFRFTTVLGVKLGSRRSSRAVGATPGEAGVVVPSSPGDDDSADTLVVSDGDDPAIPCDAVDPAGAPISKILLTQRSQMQLLRKVQAMAVQWP